MSRSLCLALMLASLAAAPGCSSCFGGFNSCRRPSFMEFRSPCSSRAPMAAPMAAPMMAPPCGAPACAPACDPCQSAAPCCEEGGVISSPASTPVVHQQGTFS
ncbi:MAG: hypothetical protein ACKOBP_01755 [Planctomycetia bacterium]